MNHIEIKRDFQIKKFSMYGFLKNLKFFEPYLIIYLLGSGYNLLQIGFLISIRELIMYIFEIPSGIIADVYGRKKELYLCFSFYIISFVLFFLARSYFVIVLAMCLFGLGEAFRSGTHKAMIYTYLEEKNWQSDKAFVYGRTRSYSLIGSAVSSVLAIVFILNVPSSNYIFLISTLPYILDLLLIASYPNSLDGRVGSNEKFFNLALKYMKDIFKNTNLRRILLSSASFEALFKSSKDYIQPILETVILSSGYMLLNQTSEDSLKIILGLSYGMIYIISSFGSKRAYVLKKIKSSEELMNIFYVLLGGSFIILAWLIKAEQTTLIIIVFVLLYLLRDIRKPIFVDVCDDYMEKHQRATALSIESQLKAMIVIIVSPILGFIADRFSISVAMLTAGLLLLFSFSLVKIKKEHYET